ncbi:MAG: bifunctional 3'-5' exonuclease/DNA polymerase [Ruminococcus flavefaciens]|nr:bifunctional 3'-5' exonuclease/DNA polymerase [Ruminococcus flavefaciens]MCM1362531.1 bifunctional 3'-5' exonuclease/DNA polymerase [Clostridiales bacterium]
MENYKCVVSVQKIQDYIGDSKIIAFDYETAPAEPYRTEEKAALDPHKSHIVGCSFSVKEHTGIYVPVAHKVGENIGSTEFLHFLQAFLTNKNITKIVHNIAFESAVSCHQGIVIQPPVYDTICAAQMTLKSNYEFRKLADSGLKRLAAELCREPLPTFTDVTNGRHFDELDAQDSETVRYGCADSDFALRLYHIFNNWFDRFLPKHRYIVEQIESPTAVYLGIMKHNGVPVDADLMKSRQQEAEHQMQYIRDEITMLIGDVEIGANCGTKAFKDYLYQTLKLPVMKVTASNKEAADDASMIMLKEWCDANRPELSSLFTLVQEYRKWGKIKSTYIDGYLKYLNSATGRIHPDFFALSTGTGRMNCRNPNIQNCPRKSNDPIGVRNLIKAPEDNLILSLDFSQIELRVGAFYCRDRTMMETYQNGGDIHAATTSVIFGCTYEEAQDKHRKEYKEQRTIAKNVNFGTFYGLFPKGLQSTLKFKAGVEKSVDECEAIIRNLKAGYPALTTWQDETKQDTARKMYIETWLGRRRYLPNIRSDNWGLKSFAERCALNTPIQGTAADILKLAIVRILEGLPSRPWLKPILQIHDELTFIIPKEKLNEAVYFIRECMEQQPFPEFDLPLVAEASAGESFGNLEELEG